MIKETKSIKLLTITFIIFIVLQNTGYGNNILFDSNNNMEENGNSLQNSIIEENFPTENEQIPLTTQNSVITETTPADENLLSSEMDFDASEMIFTTKNYNWIVDDKQKEFCSITEWDCGLNGIIDSLSKVGDIDFDNRDETITVSYSSSDIYIKVYDDMISNPAFREMGSLIINIEDYHSIFDSFGEVNMILGDLDGNNDDEIIISATANSLFSCCTNLWVYDWVAGTFELCHHEYYDSYHDADLATGDVDDTIDGDEILLAASSGSDIIVKILTFDIYGNYYSYYFIIEEIYEYIINTANNPQISSGNYDYNSNTEEIIVCGTATNLWGSLYIPKGVVFSDKSTSYFVVSTWSDTDPLDLPGIDSVQVTEITTGNVNQDNSEEIAFIGYDPYTNELISWIFDYKWVNGAAIDITKIWCLSEYDYEGGTYLCRATSPDIALGDFDLDGISELAFAWTDTIDDKFRSLIIDDNSTEYSIYDHWFEDQTSSTDYVHVESGMVDIDRMNLRYIQGNDLRTEDVPRINTVLIAPPMQYGLINYNPTAAIVGFGPISGEVTEDSFSWSIKNHFSITAEGSTPVIDIGPTLKQGVYVDIQKSLFSTNSEFCKVSTTLQIAQPFDYVGNFDEVCFTLHTTDHYFYEIIECEVASAVGEIISIDIPREVTYQRMRIQGPGGFNDLYPDYAIGDETLLGHKVGEVSSYKTLNDLESNVNLDIDWIGDKYDWHSDQLIRVSTASGIIEEELQITTTRQKFSNYFSFGAGFITGLGLDTGVVDWEGENTIGTLFEWSTSVSDIGGMKYKGTVPQMSDVLCNNFHYDFMMVMYDQKRDDGQEYNVVNWIVENKKPGYSLLINHLSGKVTQSSTTTGLENIKVELISINEELYRTNPNPDAGTFAYEEVRYTTYTDASGNYEIDFPGIPHMHYLRISKDGFETNKTNLGKHFELDEIGGDLTFNIDMNVIYEEFSGDDFNSGISDSWNKVYPTGTDDFEWVSSNGHAVPKILSGRDNYANTYLEYTFPDLVGSFDTSVRMYKYAPSTATQLYLVAKDDLGETIALGGIYDPWASSSYKERAYVNNPIADAADYSWFSGYQTYNFDKTVRICRDGENQVYVFIGGSERARFFNDKPLKSIQLYAGDKWAYSYDSELINSLTTHWFDDFVIDEFSSVPDSPPVNYDADISTLSRIDLTYSDGTFQIASRMNFEISGEGTYYIVIKYRIGSDNWVIIHSTSHYYSSASSEILNANFEVSGAESGEILEVSWNIYNSDQSNIFDSYSESILLVIDQIDPVDPEDPVDPVDPINPVDPIEPKDPINPINPKEPIDID